MNEHLVKSTDLAGKIMKINKLGVGIDLEFLQQCGKDINDQAHQQETLAFMNPGYPPSKNELLRKQAKALEALHSYFTLVNECTLLKFKVQIDESGHKEIMSKLFL